MKDDVKPENISAGDLYFEGIKLFESKKFDEALEKFEKAESLGYKTLELYCYWGTVLTNLENLDAGAEKFQKAEELFPGDGSLYIYWGDALKSNKSFDLAVEKYKKAAEFDESKLNALLKWGNVFYDQKKYKEALEKYQKIIAINPDYVDAHYNIGLSSYFTGDYETAKSGFENAIRLNDENSLYHNWFADTLLNLNDYQTAVTEYEKALKFETDDENKYYTYRNLGYALVKLDKLDKAFEKFKKAEEFFQNDDGFLYIYWGDALKSKEAYDQAIKKYKKATKFNESKLNALLKWGNVFYDQKKYKEALEKYQKIIAINPDYVDAHYNIGLSSYFTGDYETAKSGFENAIRLNDENSLYHNWFADTLLNLNDYQTAVTEYEKALKFETDDENKYYTYRNLGYAQMQLNNLDGAVEKFKKAEDFFQNDGSLYIYWGYAFGQFSEFKLAEEKYREATKFPGFRFDALNELGNLALTQRKYSEAIDLFEQAIFEDKSNPVVYYNLAHCFFKKGRYTKARENWKLSLEKFEELERNNSLNSNPYFCYVFALILHHIFGELNAAAKLFEKSSDSLSNSEKLDKLSVYLELKDHNYIDEEHKFHWKVQDTFLEIEKILKSELTKLADLKEKKSQLESIKTKNFKEYTKNKDELTAVDTEISRIDEPYNYFYLGYLYFQTSRFDEAIKHFETAYKIKNSPENTDNSQISFFSKIEIHNALGICYSHLGNHQKAISFIEKAKNEYPDDFEFQNNLASAYLRAYYDAENDMAKSRYLDLAENEFKKILLPAPNNIDAVIGLGYTKIEQSEFKKQNFYEEAIRYFEKALQLAQSPRSSARITKKLKAFILYHLGYAHIKMYENSSKLLNEKLLIKANKYFQDVITTDAYHQPAIRACEFLKKNKNPLTQETFIEKYSPIVISLLALTTFVLSLSSFFWSVPVKDLSVGYFIILGFGALVFLIAGISLPQLLKLKVGSIEMEKEIKKSVPLKEDFSSITKQRSDTNFNIQGILKQNYKAKKQDEAAKSEKATKSVKQKEAATSQTTL